MPSAVALPLPVVKQAAFSKSTLSPYTVELDYTLKDLYEEGNTTGQEVYLIYALNVFPFALTSGLPPSQKYVYQNALMTAPPHLLSMPYAHNACHWFGFVTGAMPLIMFDLDDATTGNDVEGPRKDTRDHFAQFPPHQRPTLIDVKSVADITLPPNAALFSTVPIDATQHLPQAVPLDNHYRALSKRDLALSPLPTPPQVVVDSQLSVAAAQDDPAAREAELARMLAFVEAKPAPFVVKLPQSYGALGTFMVRCEADRANTLEILRRELEIMLRGICEDNHHLNTANIVVQELIPGETAAVSGFVTRTGRAVVTSVTGQAMGDTGLWEGNWIDYAVQDAEKAVYQATMQKIADWLHSLGYFGAFSTDIMINGGDHIVVDVNPRVSGSHPLGFLTNHLYKKRGFRYARSWIVCTLCVSKEEFVEKFDAEMRAGRVIIGGWSHHPPDRKVSSVKLIIAGEDKEAVAELRVRVQKVMI